MRAGCSDLECTLGECLAAHVDEIRQRSPHRERARRQAGEKFATRHVCADGEQVARGMHDRIADERGLGRRRRRQHEGAAIAPRRKHHRQRAANGAQLAGER